MKNAGAEHDPQQDDDGDLALDESEPERQYGREPVGLYGVEVHGEEGGGREPDDDEVHTKSIGRGASYTFSMTTSTALQGTARLMGQIATLDLQAHLDHPTGEAARIARSLLRQWAGAPRNASIKVDQAAMGVTYVGKVVMTSPMETEGAFILARHQMRQNLAKKYAR